MYYELKYCYVCCRDRGHYNGKCGDCSAIESMKKHREHFALLDSMTLEERIRRLEKHEYEQNINPPWAEPRC
jgi:hypothetical protein